MAKNDSKQQTDIHKDRRFAGAFRQLTNILNQSNLQLYGTDRDSEVDRLDDEFQTIMRRELEHISGHGDGDTSSFLTKLWDADRKGSAYMNHIDGQFMNIGADEASVMSSYIQEMYRNRFVAQNDLHEVASSLIELSEAIDITRDAIVSADVVEGRVSRTLNFEVNSDDTEEDLIPMVEQMEDNFKLLFKIKNFIVPMTLEYGEYFSYTIPYSKLFENFMQTKERMGVRHAYRESFTESTALEYCTDTKQKRNSSKQKTTKERGKCSSAAKEIYQVYKESTDQYTKLTKTDGDDIKTASYTQIKEDAFTQDIDNMLDRVSVCNDPVPIPFLEMSDAAIEMFLKENCGGTPMEEAAFGVNEAKQDKETGKYSFDKVSGNDSAGGSESIKFTSDSKKVPKSDFSDISSCYIRLYDPTKIIPVKIMNKCIGYYIILTNSNVAPLNGAVSTTLFYSDVDDTRRCERTIVDQLADVIVRSFDKEFLNDNLEFKELIVEAITYYNLNENRIKFQFVPCEYIQEFKIDQDVDGNGQSMIKKSLFYAKLYLMLLLFKIMTIIQNSNDVKVNYIRSSGIDKNLANKVQEIARMKQSRQINMADLFNYTTLINKVGAGSEMYIPTGRSNERPMETEILAGQDVQLDTPLLENLKNSYILGTGVPAAILNYLHEADFSRTQELNNTKFNGRVVNYQIDFNESITEWYKKIMHFSTNIPVEYIDGFSFTLQPPKSAATTVKNEAIQNFQSISDFVSLLYFGDNSEGDALVAKQIAQFKRLFAEEQLPMLNWDSLNELRKIAMQKAQEEELRPSATNGDGGDDIGLDMMDMQ